MSPNGTIRVAYDPTIESAVCEITALLKSGYGISKRAVALLLLQQDPDIGRLVQANEGERFAGISAIVERTARSHAHPLSYVIRMALQQKASEITASVVTAAPPEKMPFREKLSRAMINPLTGIPILIVIVYLALYQFVGVIGAGKLVEVIEGTLFGEHINPFFSDLINDHIPYQSIRDLFVGEFGLLTLGITYAVAIVLPIVGTFFLVFSIIEDSGYLPRLSLLVDGLFKKIGLTGRAVIPLVLGLGCDTMATMVTRTQETRRERVIATLLLALAIPCAAQLGVILAVLSGHPGALIVWIAVLILSFMLVGFLASRILPGEKPSFYMELPPLRWPRISNVLTKTYTRMVWYFKEVLPIFLAVSLIAWALDLVGVMDAVLDGLRPVVGWIGLPEDTARVFLFGFFRRDYGAAGLYDIQQALTGVQLAVAAVTLTLFVPCIAQFMMMVKERGIKTALAIFAFVVVYAFSIGFLLNRILSSTGASL